MDRIIVRDMTQSDIDSVYRIEKECFSSPWTREAFLKEICENERAYYLVALIDRSVVGYIGLWKILDEGHITNIAVDSDYRNMGIGRELLKAVIDNCQEYGINSLTLEVRRLNENAQKLYYSQGFKSVGIRPKYYENSEDAMIMWKDIK